MGRVNRNVADFHDPSQVTSDFLHVSIPNFFKILSNDNDDNFLPLKVLNLSEINMYPINIVFVSSSVTNIPDELAYWSNRFYPFHFQRKCLHRFTMHYDAPN